MKTVLVNSWLVLFVGLLGGCKLYKEDSTESTFDVEDVESIVTPAINFSQTAPSELWPPEERRAGASFHYLVGESEVLRGNMKEALAKFQLAYNLDPNSFLGGKLIAAQASAGDSEEALVEARRMVLLYPKSPHLRILYGQLLGADRQFDKGIQQIEKAISIDPDIEEAYVHLISFHQELGQVKKSMDVAQKFREAIPGSVLSWSILSRLYILTGEKEKALEAAKQAYEMQSSNPELILVYAYALELNKKRPQAIFFYDKIFRMNPSNDELAGRMLQLYREVGSLNDALAMLDEMVASDDGDRPSLHVQRVLILWELKELKAAAVLTKDLAQRFSQSDRILYVAGLAHERIGQFDEALGYYEGVPSESEFFVPSSFRRGFILRTQKNYEGALKIVQEIVKGESPEWENFVLLAGIYADMEKFAESIKTLDDGLRRFPDHSRLLFLKGVNQERLGKVDDCIETMRKVIEVDPKESAAFNYLGYLYAERNEKLDEAKQLILTALKLKPDDGYYLDSLGWVYFRKGDYEKALFYLQKAASLNPKEGVIWDHIGEVYKKMGENSKAIEYFQKALDNDLEPKDRKKLEEKMKEMIK